MYSSRFKKNDISFSYLVIHRNFLCCKLVTCAGKLFQFLLHWSGFQSNVLICTVLGWMRGHHLRAGDGLRKLYVHLQLTRNCLWTYCFICHRNLRGYLLIDDYAKYGGPEAVSILCSFCHDTCTFKLEQPLVPGNFAV